MTDKKRAAPLADGTGSEENITICIVTDIKEKVKIK